MTTVRCQDCGREVDESPDTPQQDRRPCPACGALGRAFSVYLADTVGMSEAASPAREFIKRRVLGASTHRTSGSGTLSAALRRHEKVLKPLCHRVECLEPAGPDGSYTIQAYDDDDHPVAMAEGATWDDTIRAVVEDLRP